MLCKAQTVYISQAQYKIRTSATSLCWFHLTAFSSLGREEGIFSSRCILVAGGGGLNGWFIMYQTMYVNLPESPYQFIGQFVHWCQWVSCDDIL